MTMVGLFFRHWCLISKFAVYCASRQRCLTKWTGRGAPLNLRWAPPNVTAAAHTAFACTQSCTKRSTVNCHYYSTRAAPHSWRSSLFVDLHPGILMSYTIADRSLIRLFLYGDLLLVSQCGSLIYTLQAQYLCTMMDHTHSPCVFCYRIVAIRIPDAS